MTEIQTTQVALITQRLRIIPLDLELCKRMPSNLPAIEDRLHLAHSQAQIPDNIAAEMQSAIEHMVGHMAEDPINALWYTHWLIITKSEHRVIGGTGFAGPPNQQGQVITGYWIDSRYQNQGYMTEALTATTAWAFSHSEVKVVLAETPKDNRSSQRVLEKNGFRILKERKDTLLWEMTHLPHDPLHKASHQT